MSQQISIPSAPLLAEAESRLRRQKQYARPLEKVGGVPPNWKVGFPRRAGALRA